MNKFEILDAIVEVMEMNGEIEAVSRTDFYAIAKDNDIDVIFGDYDLWLEA